VTFKVSTVSQPLKTFTIAKAFTADDLGLAEHSYQVEGLQRKYRHLRKLPLQPFTNAQPPLLIGSDCPHLVTPIQPVRFQVGLDFTGTCPLPLSEHSAPTMSFLVYYLTFYRAFQSRREAVAS